MSTEVLGGTLAAHADNFQRRVMQDMFTEALASYWLRRSATYAAVGTPRCDEIALACRRHATLVPFPDDVELVDLVLGEVA